MHNHSAAEETVVPLPEEGAGLALVSVALSLTAIVSNGLLLYVVIRTTALHTSTNFFIASLSAGEFLTGTFVIPFAGTLFTPRDWAFLPGVCTFVGVVGVLGPCVSAFSLLVVTADRYVAISKPLRYAHVVNRTCKLTTSIIVWILSLLISLLPLASWGRYSYSVSFRMCVMRNSPIRADNVPEVVIKEVFCTFIPVGLVILIVLKTVHQIRGHRRVFAFVPVPITAMSLPVGPGNINRNNSTMKATRTLLLVSVAFVMLCVPSAVVSVLCQRPSTFCVATRVPRMFMWLSFLSCVINPLTIMTLNAKFRARLKALFFRGYCAVLKAGADQETFTIVTGLQNVLEASLLVNVIHGRPGPQDLYHRRQVIMTLQTGRAMEQTQPVFVRRLGSATLRRTQSSTDCRMQSTNDIQEASRRGTSVITSRIVL